MHAQSGTVGAPALTECITVESVVTLRIPKTMLIAEFSADKIASDLGDDLQDMLSDFAAIGIEIGVRSRVL